MSESEYVSAAEAGRILGVSRQRVSQMLSDGDLPHVKPWPRAVRIPRTAIESWQRGERRMPVTKTAMRSYILASEGVDDLGELDATEISDVCDGYIYTARPEWDEAQKDEWVQEMTAVMLSWTRSPK